MPPTGRIDHCGIRYGRFGEVQRPLAGARGAPKRYRTERRPAHRDAMALSRTLMAVPNTWSHIGVVTPKFPLFGE
jgi:hypothetical protein